MSGWPAAVSARQPGVHVAMPVAVALRAEAHEDPVVAVDVRLAEGLAVDRDDADAGLARRLGDELLEPGAERRQVWLDDEGELVAPRAGERGHGRAEDEGRVVVRVGARPVGHEARVLEEGCEVEARQRRRARGPRR